MPRFLSTEQHHRSITRVCPHCRRIVEAKLIPLKDTKEWEDFIVCPLCRQRWVRPPDDESAFDRCIYCGGRQFYRQKDFPRGVGCLIVLIAIALVPKTYGLSLVVCVLLDALVYRQCPDLVVCYQCGAEYRGFHVPERLKPYIHAIGLKYDRRRRSVF